MNPQALVWSNFIYFFLFSLNFQESQNISIIIGVIKPHVDNITYFHPAMDTVIHILCFLEMFWMICPWENKFHLRFHNLAFFRPKNRACVKCPEDLFHGIPDIGSYILNLIRSDRWGPGLKRKVVWRLAQHDSVLKKSSQVTTSGVVWYTP